MDRGSRTRRQRVIAAVISALAVAGMAGAASAAAKPRTALIVEGRSIGGLTLGDTRARAAAIFGSVKRCTRSTDQLGSECELGFDSHVTATFDLLGRAEALTAFYRTNVSQPIVPPLLRDRRYATRRGVGAALMSGRLRHFYGARLKKATGPGNSPRPPLYVTGPRGYVTAFEYVGALKGGQVTHVTVARWLKPAVTVTPASAGPGSVVRVAASGLLPGAPERVSLVFGTRNIRVLAAAVTAAANGTRRPRPALRRAVDRGAARRVPAGDDTTGGRACASTPCRRPTTTRRSPAGPACGPSGSAPSASGLPSSSPP